MKNVVRKKTVAKIGVSLMAVLGVFAIIGGISFASGEGNKPFLDDYIEYGIVCNHLNQTADMETNFVAGEYAGNGHYTGNTVSEDKANAAGRIRIGEVLRSNGEKGEAKHVKLHSKETDVSVDPAVKEETKELLKKVGKYAVSLLKEKDITLPNEVRDQNNYLVDISKVDKKTVYVEADNLAMALKDGHIQNGGLKIKLRAEQTMVLNIKEDIKEFFLPRYTVTVTEGKKTKDEIAQTVIWNMPNLNSLNIGSDNLAATVIAPQAFVNICATGEGWLVCDTLVSNNGGEWHMIYRDIPDTKVTPTPKVTKKPTPKPTEKPTPTETPEPEPTDKGNEDPKDPNEPTPTPTVTPKETEKPTPTVTPKETEKPTPTPTVTPKETEKPTPTPTVTPKETEAPTPTPEETPKVTETPTPKATETPEPEQTITPVPDPEETVTPEPTPTSTATVMPGETPTVTPDVTPAENEPTPDPDETPEATTPGEEPTATPDGSEVVPPDGSPTPVPKGSKTIKDDDPPTTSLDDPGVPKAKMTPSAITKIKDGDVPLAPGVPETGDDTNLFVPVLVMGASALALIIVLICIKKKSE